MHTLPFNRIIAGMIVLTALLSFGIANPAPEVVVPPGEPLEATPPTLPDRTAPGVPEPIQEALASPARPGLLLSQAWFWRDENKRIRPGPARLQIWREQDDGQWGYTRLEDGDSNVFHKAIPYRDGILTIGAENALLKYWTYTDNGWQTEVLWKREWGGKFDRLRDLEIGDVDEDGEDEIVIATHDNGVVAVIDLLDSGEQLTVSVTELDPQADTFIHEIELGDFNGDGVVDILCTPTARAEESKKLAGRIAMYQYEGATYRRSWFGSGPAIKEILLADMNGDGVDELYALAEAEMSTDAKREVLTPVTMLQYTISEHGILDEAVIATFNDRAARFLVPGDFDNDGQLELIATTMKSGIYHLRPGTPNWTVELINKESGGFEHSAQAADLNNDGVLELYVADDSHSELNRYIIKDDEWVKTTLGTYPDNTITWNIEPGVF